jgi:hypothetical protein
MVDVALLALSGTSSIAMAGLFDVIAKADAAYGALQGRPGRDLIFDLDLVGLDEGGVRLDHRIVVTPDLPASAVRTAELVVVPGLDDDLQPSFEANTAWAPWIASSTRPARSSRRVAAARSSSPKRASSTAVRRRRTGCTPTPSNVGIRASTSARAGSSSTTATS